MNRFGWLNAMKNAIAATFLFVVAGPVLADVSVVIQDPNTAVATVKLPSAATPTYTATVTIRFDNAANLSADALNVTAQLVNPTTFAGLPAGVAVDPNFPVLVSVEPPIALFRSGLESNQSGDGNLSFTNTYELEIHSDEHITCSSTASNFRLYKAPHGSNIFADVTDFIYQGSVRARGRGGAFSQFVIVHDTQSIGLPILPIVGGLLDLTGVLLTKVTGLVSAILTAGILNPTLLSGLLATVTQVVGDLLLLNVSGAIADLGGLVNTVLASAGTEIPNVWSAAAPLNNGAGQILSAADTLNFTLELLLGTPTCTAPPTP
jgi:hypothetical protein